VTGIATTASFSLIHDGLSHIVNNQADSTPLATRVILLIVLAITSAVRGMFLLGWIGPGKPYEIASILWLFTGLFVLRVAGQILVALRPQRWLPPMKQWNFLPYPILLPIQIVFIVVMFWIDVSFTMSTGSLIAKNPGTGYFLIYFSYFYLMAMVIRYVIRMYRRPDQRWFGRTIPIVFHIVLASYLYTLGRFYVSI
jgi:hypothetical protein